MKFKPDVVGVGNKKRIDRGDFLTMAGLLTAAVGCLIRDYGSIWLKPDQVNGFIDKELEKEKTN